VPLVQYEYVDRYVDRPVYVDRYGYGWDDCGEPYYGHGYGYGHYGYGRHARSTFPLNTALGAGVGAVIGHQSRHRNEGALIGAGLGLLLDFGHWCW